MQRLNLNGNSQQVGGGAMLNDLVAGSTLDGVQRNFYFNGTNLAGLQGQLQGTGNITLGGSGVPPSGAYPQGIALFSDQFGQIFPQLNTMDTRTMGSLGDGPDILDMPGPSRSGGDGGTSRSSTAYASRHQAAEQRRRTRINERLDLLRKMVPHTERSNTACFLEEVLKYIDALKTRVVDLESTLQAIRTGKTVPAALLGGGSSAPRALPKVELTHGGQQQGPGQHHMLNVGYSMQQMQQQQMQQQHVQQQQQQIMLQQQHEAALSALREEQQQQTAAIQAMQQLKHQHENARPSPQLADLAGKLGLKFAEAEAGYGGGGAGVGQRSSGAAPATPSTSIHLPPVPQLQMPTMDAVAAVVSAAGVQQGAAVEVPQEGNNDSKTVSPATSEENGMPLKKRKVLLL